MNEQLIKEIIASEITVTTLVKTLQLTPEQGSANISLNNLRKILNSPLELEVTKITFLFNIKHPLLKTEWVTKDDDFLTWDFRGFSAGDKEEKSKALVKALHMLKVKNWDIETVNGLQSNKFNIL